MGEGKRPFLLQAPPFKQIPTFSFTNVPAGLQITAGAVVRSDGTSDVQPLTGSFGETLKLDTPDTQLIGEYGIIWSHVQGGTTTVLIHYDAGKWEKNATDKHQLDEKTGSLIIRSLTANDSGLYQRQLISETEGIVKTQKFIVTVVEPSSYSATPTQTSADHSTAGPKPTTPPLYPTEWIIGVLIGFAVLLCAVLLFNYREKIRERFRVRYAPCDREDPGRSSRQENVAQDTAVQDTAVQIQLCRYSCVRDLPQTSSVTKVMFNAADLTASSK